MPPLEPLFEATVREIATQLGLSTKPVVVTEGSYQTAIISTKFGCVIIQKRALSTKVNIVWLVKQEMNIICTLR